MEQFLTAYINRMRPLFNGIPATTAHEIASAFLAFKFGLYPNAIHECTQAISLIPESGVNAALKKALSIVRANATNLENAQVTADMTMTFSDEESSYIPVNLSPNLVEDPGTFQLDNALVFIYAVAVIGSPDDEETLIEHRKFIVRLLTGYKKALGLS
ncbi:MAG: hypothetical protein LUO90_00215 [Methanoregula sp.]|nr:hypothetical protein [Methanoregula sp.]